MHKKALKFALLLGLVSLVVLTAGVVMAEGKKEIPNYVGSKVCLGCHASKWQSWGNSGHANMIVAVTKPADLPGNINATTPELKAELAKADFIVAGQRFLARDGATGDLMYLNVVWNPTTQQYDAYKGGSNWNNSCAGCHSTNYDKATRTPSEYGISCEQCHGPGRDHIAGKGDITKITVSASSDVCGQCHGAGKMLDGTGWVVGYRPNMKLSDVPGISLKVVDFEAIVPTGSHLEYPEWKVSGHGPAKAVEDLRSNSHASGSCYKCHTNEAYTAKAGTTFVPDKNADYVGVSCVTCHRAHSLSAPDSKTLCITCHTASVDPKVGLKAGATSHHGVKEFFGGYGTVGNAITSNGNVHKDLGCAECHMTENNHLFKIIRPDDAALAEARADSCTACHKDSSKDVRAAYLQMWQNTTTSKMDALNADIALIKAAAAVTPLTADQKLSFDTAVTNMTLITADKSKGAHNFDFASRILTDAKKRIDAVKAAVVH